MTDNSLIREATVVDAAGIAQVHVTSWRETYAGLVSAEYLRNLSVEKRTEGWEEAFREAPGAPWKVFVAEEDGLIKGFISIGQSRKPEFVYNGEVYALYLLKESQGRGLGRALFEKALSHFRQHGINSIYLWVLDGNSTLDFYRHMGGQEIARQPLTIGGEEVGETALAWKNI